MRRPIPEDTGLRGGDRGGRHERPLEICDDSVTIGAEGAGWDSEKYIDENGQARLRMTRS